MQRQVLLVLVALISTRAQAQMQEELTRFDYHRIELRRYNESWQLVANGKPLKDFGRREADARQALRLIHDLRLTHHGTIGTPQPIVEYWLSDGAAPRGLVRGLRLTALDPQSTRAEQVQGQWRVRDDRQVLFEFGPNESDARRTVETIQRYGFNQLGTIGQGAPSMMYFLVHYSDKGGGPAGTPTSASMPGHNQPLVVRPVGAAAPAREPLKQPAVPSHPLSAVLPSGRQLAPPPVTPQAGAPAVERVPIDGRAVQLKQENKDWKIVCGTRTLASFGRSERDARLALAVFQRYRFTEECRVGHPKPTCSYYLVNGQAPRGHHLGVSSVSFRPENLTVRERGEAFMICEGNRGLLNFGEHEQDARTVLQAIQHHKFDRWCHIGRAGQGGMTFFVRAR